MEEKLMIESGRQDYWKHKNIVFKISGILAALGFVMYLLNVGQCRKWVNYKGYVRTNSLFEVMFEGYFAGVLIDLGIVILLLWFLIGLVLCAGHLVITNKRVYGEVALGSWVIKRVNLPLDAITAVATGIFGSLTVVAPGGRISFWGLSNRNEMYDALVELLNARQK